MASLCGLMILWPVMVVLRLRPGITGPATLKYRLEDEMIFATVLGRKVRYAGGGDVRDMFKVVL